MPDNFFVLTGGPGSGKSSVIQALAARGHAVVGESGRAVIRQQRAAGGDALPWADRLRFADRMLARDLRAHAAAPRDRTVFFDRGVPDIAGYLALCGLPVPARLRRAVDVCRYADKVFVFPHWPGIYAHDAERRQGEDEALATLHAVVAAYRDRGYATIAVPRLSVERRADFIVSHLA